MPSVQALSYDPTLKTVTVAGDIATVNLTSIINYTRGKDLFVVGRTPIINRGYSGGNTTFTLDTDTIGDSASDVIAVRYQSSDIITTISNGTTIGDVAHFVQNTKPTTRIGVSPLVIGDRWYRTTFYDWWRWNGTYWVTEQSYSAMFSVSTAQTYTPTFVDVYNESSNTGVRNIFVESIGHFCRVNLQAPINVSNLATFSFTGLFINGGYTIGSFTTLEMVAVNPRAYAKVINQVFGFTNGGTDGFLGSQLVVTNTGSPGFYGGTSFIKYRYYIQ